MKKGFPKECGKFLLDLCKIMFAIAFITPLVKGEQISIVFICVIVITAIIGIFLLYKGVNYE